LNVPVGKSERSSTKDGGIGSDVDFVNLMLETVRRKSLVPKLFGVRLSGVLFNAILSALVSLVITFLKVFVPSNVPV